MLRLTVRTKSKCAILLLALMGFADTLSARTLSVSEQFAEVQEMISVREVDAEQVIGPLITQLGQTKSESDRSALLSGIVSLARDTSTSPSYIRAYIQSKLPPIALRLAGDTSLDWVLRGAALMALREIAASKDQLEQAVQIARSDQSKNRDYIASRGRLLQSYLDHRLNNSIANVEFETKADLAKERTALAFLRTRGLNATFDQLTASIAAFEPEEVRALFDASVYTAQLRESEGDLKLWFSLTTACSSARHKLARAPEIVKDLLANRLDINVRDSLNNAPLLITAQYCPLVVVRALVEGGAKLNVFNAQKVSELSMAILGDRWDVVRYLVDQGARMPKQAIDDLFIELPEEQDKLAILKKAELKP